MKRNDVRREFILHSLSVLNSIINRFTGVLRLFGYKKDKQKWTQPLPSWGLVAQQLSIKFGSRMALDLTLKKQLGQRLFYTPLFGVFNTLQMINIFKKTGKFIKKAYFEKGNLSRKDFISIFNFGFYCSQRMKQRVSRCLIF